jgi:anaerobic selenocysteine-containing dehydrogenase
MSDRRFRSCNLCEAMCGLTIEVDGERIVKISGDEADPFSRGYICIKGEALADLHTDPNRLRRPVRRRGSDWEEIGWDEALDEVAERLRAIQKAHGRDAVASYTGNPAVHNYGTMLTLLDVLRALRSRNRFSATSLDQLPHHVTAHFLFGHQLLLPVPDIDRTRFLLILGGNPVVSRGSMMTAPDVTERLKAIRARGGKIVLVDPRRTETAAVVDEHCFIRPGTDAALLLGMLHVIFAAGLTKLGRLDAFTDGLATVAALVQDVSLAAVARTTGISAETVERLARDFAAAESAVCYGRFGASTQEFGALAQWLLTVLNIVTGNLDRAGGAMFTTPALDPLPHISRGHFDRWRSRVRGLPEFAGELPTCVLAEEIATPGPGQVRGLLTVAGNPVLSSPNGSKLQEALAGLDFMASVDLFVNETTRFAHIILPPTGALEHEHYDIAFHLLAVRNTAKFSPALFPPASDARHDWQILRGLAGRLSPRSASPLALAKRLASRLATPERIVDLGLRFGTHRLSLAKLRRAPHGIDLGPLEPRLPKRLYTPARRIELAPAPFVKDLERLRRRLSPDSTTAAAEKFDLLLIGRRQVRSNNSWMGHIPRLTKGKTTCTALIHTSDAASRGIKSGDLVRVSSRVGTVVLPAVVIEGIMPGVVSIPHGFGHGRAGVRLDFDERALGVSANDLTDESVVDALVGTAVLNGVPVRLEPA